MLPFALSFWVTACTSMKVLEPPLERSMAAEQPSSVTVTLEDGQELKIVSPTISRDSVVGVTGYRMNREGRAADQRLAVALSEVAFVEYPTTSFWRTLGAAYLALAVAGGVFFCLSGSEVCKG